MVIPILRPGSAAACKSSSDEQPEESLEVDLSFGCLNTCLGAEYSMRNWNMIITLEKR